MRITYAVLAVLLAVPSAILGYFYLASAGLAASAAAMSIAVAGWAMGVLVVIAGLVFAIRRSSMGALLSLCCMPFGLALGIAQLTLRFGQ
jgi:hypothetical protein